MAKTPSIGSRVRNKLADITNSKSIKPHVEYESASKTLHPNQEVIDQLVKENMALMKLIVERNKIIDLSGAELQKLRASIQKLQLQNWHLAQSNSRFLAEINFGRDRVKSLEHEIECKEALLRAKCLNLEGKAGMMNNGNSVWQEGEKPTGQSSLKTDIKACNGNKKHAGRTKSQSMGPSTSYSYSYSSVADKEKVEGKRHCVRRQSGRFRNQVRDPEENLFEIEDVKFPATGKEEEEEERKNNIQLEEAPFLPQRYSIGRPLRRAAEKIQSYKE